MAISVVFRSKIDRRPACAQWRALEELPHAGAGFDTRPTPANTCHSLTPGGIHGQDWQDEARGLAVGCELFA